jgi:sugar lactone lactonase YvrE
MALMVTGLFATDFTVSGAGSDEVNGVYIPDGTNDWGYPMWTHESGMYFIHSDGMEIWVISSYEDIMDPNETYYYAGVFTDFDEEQPPYGDWEIGMYGIYPAPNVAIVTEEPPPSQSPPSFTSTPITSIDVGYGYSYTITTDDLDGDFVTVTAPTIPDWLEFTPSEISYDAPVMIGSGFGQPRGVFVSSDGTIYAADTNNNAIKKMNADGTNIQTIGSGFNIPHSVFVSSDGTIYVADTGNHAIKKMNTDGTNIQTIASALYYPSDVFVTSDGTVYITDDGNNAVKKMNADGTNIQTIGSGFNYPTGVFVSSAGTVYVADAYNNAIKKMNADGTNIQTIGSGFNQPFDVYASPDGTIYVMDTGHGMIKTMNADGTNIQTLASDEFHSGNHFQGAWNIFVSSDRNVYIADGGNAIEKMYVTVSDPILTGTPTNDEIGDHPVVLTADDSNGGMVNQEFIITVILPNTAPIANNIAVETDEDVAVAITLTGTDVDEDELTFTVVDAPTNGIYADGFYTPNVNFSGTDSFTYKANDGELDSNIATVTITVNEVNTAPTFTSTPITSVDEDSEYSYEITTTDVDGDAVAVTAPTIPDWLNLQIALSFTEQTGIDNPCDGIDIGEHSSPAFVDIDGDGDFDMFVGDFVGTISYYENTGSDINPIFTEQTSLNNPLNDVNVASWCFPTFVDIDNDGDQDVFIGEQDNYINYFENTGSNNSPEFTEQTGTNNPFNGVYVSGGKSNPDFVDIDNDGDQDVFIGEQDGFINYYSNTGSSNSPEFTEQTGINNPFNGIDFGYASDITFVDIDNDGDFDALIGRYEGLIHFYKNTGISSSPEFTEQIGSSNPFDNIDVGRWSTPEFVDINDDGYQDVFIGEQDGNISYYKNNTFYLLSGTPTNDNVGDNAVILTTDDGTDTVNQEFTITVNNVNDAPIANDIEVTTDEDVAVAIELIGTDADGDDLTYYIIDFVTNGILDFSETDNAVINYTPNANWYGTDSFTYSVNDGELDAETATVTITVNYVNNAPTFTSTPITSVDEDSPYSYTITTSDADGDIVTVTAPTIPNWIELTQTGGDFIEPVLVGSGFTDFNQIELSADGSTLYFAYSGQNTVSKINVDGTGYEVLNNEHNQPNDIAVSSDNNTIYFTSYSEKSIYKMNTDGTNVSLVWESPDWLYLYNLTLSPDNNILYFTYENADDSYSVSRVNIDGTGFAVLGSEVWYGDIEVSPDGNTLYSTTFGDHHQIVTMNVDGSNKIFTDVGFRGRSISIAANGAIFIVANYGEIMKIVKMDADVSNLTDVSTSVDIPYVLAVNSNGSLIYTLSDAYGELFKLERIPIVYTLLGTPLEADIGNHTIVLTASDGTNAVNQEFTITVNESLTAPVAVDDFVIIDEDIPFELATLLENDTDPNDNELSIESYTQPAHGVVGTGGSRTDLPNKIYWTDHDNYYIMRSNLDGSDAEELISSEAYGLALDMTNEHMYFWDYDEDEIYRTNLDASEEPTYILGVYDCYSIALDIPNGKIYYSNANNSKLYRANLDGSEREMILDDVIALSITVDSQNEKLYYFNAYYGQIESCNLDGGEQEAILEAESTIMNSLAFDFANGKMYFGYNGEMAGIFRANLDGSDVEPIFAYTRVHQLDLDLVNNKIYFTVEVGGTLIARCNLDGSDPEELLEAYIYSQGVLKLNNPTDAAETPLTYTPNANWFGTDSFTYNITNGTEVSDYATVTVTVNPVNDIPVTEDIATETDEDVAVAITLTGTDADGDYLTYSIQTDATNGTAEIIEGAYALYTPNANWSGTDTFTYIANDGELDSDIATVTITVNEVLDPPSTPLNVQIVVTYNVDHAVCTLTWDAVTGSDFYNVYACDTPDGEFVQINSEPIIETTFELIITSQMKFYRVTANNGEVVTISPKQFNFRNLD